MKTSKKYFEQFKAEFLRWLSLLGLTQYEIVFYHQKMKVNSAQVSINERAKLVEVCLSTELPKSDHVDGPLVQARHEAIHVLTYRLRFLGGCRYISDDELDDEWEAITRRLEKVLV